MWKNHTGSRWQAQAWSLLHTVPSGSWGVEFTPNENLYRQTIVHLWAPLHQELGDLATGIDSEIRTKLYDVCKVTVPLWILQSDRESEWCWLVVDPYITSSCDVLGMAGWDLWVHTRPSPLSQQGELSQGRATAGWGRGLCSCPPGP